eukprot:c7351_g1_i2.p1 GENE.c7351_g1_i2~~c7351_g1_i2.p1  ORF type:complete len:409 (+),score=93.18 c7351_g1_i2:115-1227(+)
MADVKKSDLDLISLGQGIVSWGPPAEAVEATQKYVSDPQCHLYQDDEGIRELRDALKTKLRVENNIQNVDVMVTSGANQAYINLALTLCDSNSKAVLFAPYYFNHIMALQMTSCVPLIAPTDQNLLPDVEWLRNNMTSDVKMVTIVNPGNPSGTIIPEQTLREISDVCQQHEVWLVIDNTYEYFVFDEAKHTCIEGPHIVNLFSFSKAFGMMGWRVGYLAFSNSDEALFSGLLKAQDTIAICASIFSQRLALEVLSFGRSWVQEKLAQLDVSRSIIREALVPLGPAAIRGLGNGSIYMLVALPKTVGDDRTFVKWMATKYGVFVIPGSAHGFPMHFRVCVANLPHDRLKIAAARLREAMVEISNPQFKYE